MMGVGVRSCPSQSISSENHQGIYWVMLLNQQQKWCHGDVGALCRENFVHIFPKKRLHVHIFLFNCNVVCLLLVLCLLNLILKSNIKKMPCIICPQWHMGGT